MKPTSSIRFPITGLVFVGLMAVSACATDTGRVPPLANVAHIRLGAGPWSLSILPDGSGALGYGSSAFDFASIPGETFDFGQVYGALAAVVSPDGNIREWFSVAFYETDKAETYSQYTREAELVLGLFKTAKDKCRPLDKTRMDELWEQRPPAL
ncbi:MAG TPA: hypothetical protein VF268_03130 [Gammaproteobacteria bacterium]